MSGHGGPTGERITGQLATVWASITELGSGLNEADWDTPTDLPGWTAKDCLSHMAGTEAMLLGEPVPDVSVDHIPRVTSSFIAMMEVPVEARRATPAAKVMAEFVDVTNRRLAVLAELSDEEWSIPGWSPVGEVPYATFMEVRVFDCWMHDQDIRRAVGRPGGINVGAEVSLGRIELGLGFVVGKRAGAPDGTSAVFEVTGPYPRTYAVVVDGRAGLTDDIPTDPTVRITTDLEVFTALGGGRWSGERAMDTGRVTVTGDNELAGRILSGMAITP
jgi:uncharacterized protein (TIGR03083 family)